jgi:hypothetical protein
MAAYEAHAKIGAKPHFAISTTSKDSLTRSVASWATLEIEDVFAVSTWTLRDRINDFRIITHI